MNNETKHLVEKCYYQHDIACNQKYGNDDLPYSFHLKAVVAQVEKYFPGNKSLILGAAGHDLIEDARMTLNDVSVLLGPDVADIIYCCTEEKGRNRSERHSEKFFEELSQNRNAVIVKLCDIMANILYSKLMNSSMYQKYQQEFDNVCDKLYISGEYDTLWEDLAHELGSEF